MSSVEAAPRSAPRVVSAHQVSVDSLDAGATTRAVISASARSRWRQAGPSRAGSPSAPAIACTAATCPCGSEPVMLTACPRRPRGGALRRRRARVAPGVGRPGRAGGGLVPDLAAGGGGAPRVAGLVVGAAPLFVHMAAADPGHMHRRTLLAHTATIGQN